MGEEKRRSVAIIIPAFNEELRIANVARAAAKAKLATEVIVVCDGCRDRTADVARRVPGVKVVELPDNKGKAAAMYAGVRATDAEVLAFVDADLAGLNSDHIDRIIRPILNNHCEMCIGVFRGGKFWSDTAQKFAPYISGQRAMKRQVFEAVPGIQELRYGAEVAINSHAKRTKARVLRVVLRGVSNCHKENKLGLMKGFAARIKMWDEIGQAMVKNRRRRKPPSNRWRWK